MCCHSPFLLASCASYIYTHHLFHNNINHNMAQSSSASINDWGTQVRDLLGNVLGDDRPAKKGGHKGASRANASGTRRLREGENPWDEEHSGWLTDTLLERTSGTFGHAVNQRFEQNEARLANLEAQRDAVSELQLKVLELEQRLGPLVEGAPNVRQQMDDIQQQAEQARKAAGVASQRAEAARMAAERPRAAPSEERTLARLGNLGWDDLSDTLKLRAEQVLREANIPDAEWDDLTPCTGRQGTGSACELHFTSSNALLRAKNKIRCLGKRFVVDKSVWLDVKKRSKAELKPSRCIHRRLEVIQEVEPQHGRDPAAYKKFMASKTIKKGEILIAFVARGILQLSVQGQLTRTPEERSMIENFANDE